MRHTFSTTTEKLKMLPHRSCFAQGSLLNDKEGKSGDVGKLLVFGKSNKNVKKESKHKQQRSCQRKLHKYLTNKELLFQQFFVSFIAKMEDSLMIFANIEECARSISLCRNNCLLHIFFDIIYVIVIIYISKDVYCDNCNAQ